MGVRLPLSHSSPLLAGRHASAGCELRGSRAKVRAEAPRLPKATTSSKNEDRVHRRLRYPQEPRRRDPEHVVDAEIDKVARDYSKAARIPASGPARCRPRSCGSASATRSCTTSRTGLIPRAVDEALRERGVEPVDTPDIKDVVVEEGTAAQVHRDFETVPPIDPGDYGLTLTQAGRRSRGRRGRPGAVAAARTRGALRAGRGPRRRTGDSVADGPRAADCQEAGAATGERRPTSTTT